MKKRQRRGGNVKMHYVRFIAAFLVYAVVDIVWNVSPIAVGMYEALYEASGHDALLDQFGRQIETWGPLQGLALLAFFALIAFANSYLAIEPAVAERNLGKAMRNSFALGCAAYATYVVPLYVAMSTFPGVLVPIDILIGGLLSLITSTAVTYVTLRRSAA